MDIKKIEKEFINYSKDFDLYNPNIKYKYYHSFRVEHLSTILSKELSNSKENIDLATTIGLLHDIGRYRQLELYNSFNDDNIDHADLGVKILFDNNLIKKFPIDKKYYDLIYFAIKNHNKYTIESCTYEDYLYQAKLIRDTDKIDILDMHVKNKLPLTRLNNITDYHISNDTEEVFFNQKSINKVNRHTLGDAELLRMALLYDINFDESFDIIENKQILENYYKILENKKVFIPYLDYISKYITERRKNYVRKKI